MVELSTIQPNQDLMMIDNLASIDFCDLLKVHIFEVLLWVSLTIPYFICCVKCQQEKHLMFFFHVVQSVGPELKITNRELFNSSAGLDLFKVI